MNSALGIVYFKDQFQVGEGLVDSLLHILEIEDTISKKLIKVIIAIIITRPKPAYGQQGLAGSWGQDTDQAGVLNISLRACSAQLGFKPTWNH